MLETHRRWLPSRPQNGDLIRSAGFQLNGIETHYMDGPKLMTFMYQGQPIPEPAGGSHG
jgi:hypothetical protein